MKINNNTNILKPENYIVLTETVDSGNFYGKPFERRYILLDVNITSDFLESKDLCFVFENNLEYQLYFIAVGNIGSNKINQIKIYESDQLKKEYINGELFPNGEYISPINLEYFTFNELTNGVLN